MNFDKTEHADLLEALEIAASISSDPDEVERFFRLARRFEAEL